MTRRIDKKETREKGKPKSRREVGGKKKQVMVVRMCRSVCEDEQWSMREDRSRVVRMDRTEACGEDE